MATPSSNVIALTGDPRIDGLLQGSAWAFNGSPRVLTYTLNINDTVDVGGGPLGGTWDQSPALAAAVASAFAAWSRVANITFQNVGVGGLYNQSNADIAVVLTGNELQTNAGRGRDRDIPRSSAGG